MSTSPNTKAWKTHDDVLASWERIIENRVTNTLSLRDFTKAGEAIAEILGVSFYELMAMYDLIDFRYLGPASFIDPKRASAKKQPA